jgi:pimeloyl-ACP methyl ester carboxylesterase
VRVKCSQLCFERSDADQADRLSPAAKHEEETTTPPPDLPEAVPKLFVHPTYDSVAIPHLVEKTGALPNTTIVRVEKAGHWLLQGPEAAEVESKIGDWLDSVAAGAKL